MTRKEFNALALNVGDVVMVEFAAEDLQEQMGAAKWKITDIDGYRVKFWSEDWTVLKLPQRFFIHANSELDLEFLKGVMVQTRAQIPAPMLEAVS